MDPDLLGHVFEGDTMEPMLREKLLCCIVDGLHSLGTLFGLAGAADGFGCLCHPPYLCCAAACVKRTGRPEYIFTHE
ncbi:hypothetical protein GCM10022211_26630 [Sphingomonas humi]|uniref:Uncharacterized protein n=1 Tax=Sphingomonas humi TaxID=335630 RepID=A0ABP7SEL8_9SPHN